MVNPEKIADGIRQARRVLMARAAASEADLAAVQQRLEALLDPYRDRLEAFEIYGVPMLRRPGAKAHDWFAGVNRGKGVVRFSFLPMHEHPSSSTVSRHPS